MTRKIKPTLIRLPGFVPSAADLNPSLPIAFTRESSDILGHNHPQDLLLDENHDDSLGLKCMGLETMGLEDDHLLFDQSMHFDHDIPERVCLRALLARAVC